MGFHFSSWEANRGWRKCIDCKAWQSLTEMSSAWTNTEFDNLDLVKSKTSHRNLHLCTRYRFSPNDKNISLLFQRGDDLIYLLPSIDSCPRSYRRPIHFVRIYRRGIPCPAARTEDLHPCRLGVGSPFCFIVDVPLGRPQGVKTIVKFITVIGYRARWKFVNWKNVEG